MIFTEERRHELRTIVSALNESDSPQVVKLTAELEKLQKDAKARGTSHYKGHLIDPYDYMTDKEFKRAMQISMEISKIKGGAAGAKARAMAKRAMRKRQAMKESNGDYSGAVIIRINGDTKHVARVLRNSGDDDYEDLRPRDVKEAFISMLKHAGRSMRVGNKVFRVGRIDFNDIKGIVEVHWQLVRGNVKDSDDVMDAAETAVMGRTSHFESGLIKDVADEDDMYAALIYGHPHEGDPPKHISSDLN